MGTPANSRPCILAPKPTSSLLRRVVWRHRQELHTFSPIYGIYFDRILHDILQCWPSWQAVGFASHSQPFHAWRRTCSSRALAWGMRAPIPHPRNSAFVWFIWFICAFYTTCGIHICNVAMALPSADDSIAAQTSRHHWCQNTNTIKQSSRYWGYKHHNINPDPNSTNSFL